MIIIPPCLFHCRSNPKYYCYHHYRSYLYYCYIRRTLSSSTKSNVKQEESPVDQGDFKKPPILNDKNAVSGSSNNENRFSPPPSENLLKRDGVIFEKFKNIANQNATTSNLPKRSTDFYYENRSFKTKVRHTLMRFNDRLYFVRRYRLIFAYFGFMLFMLIALHTTIAFKYGTDMPANRLTYFYRKYMGTLKPEHVLAEERLELAFKMNRQERERQQSMM